jgi:hypothetical protein
VKETSTYLLRFQPNLSIFNFAAIAFQFYLQYFLVLSVSHVEFPAVTLAHDNAAGEDSSLKSAAVVRANV